MLVIRGSSQGIRSGHKEKKGAIQLSRGPSNGQHSRDPALAADERAATLSQRFLFARRHGKS
jgi:hypothetical protein